MVKIEVSPVFNQLFFLPQQPPLIAIRMYWTSMAPFPYRLLSKVSQYIKKIGMLR
jgi:hypothetical protein